MKKPISPKHSAHLMLLFEYFVFLLSPEDSSDLPDFVKRQQTTRFDGRLHGAIKIFFWIGLAVFFWIGLLALLRISA